MLVIRHSHAREPLLTRAMLLSLVVHALMAAYCFSRYDADRAVPLSLKYIIVEIRNPDTPLNVESDQVERHAKAMQKPLKTDPALIRTNTIKIEENGVVAMNADRKAMKKVVETGTVPHQNNDGIERKIEFSGKSGSSREERAINSGSHSVPSAAAGSKPTLAEASLVSSIEPSYLALLRELIAGEKEYPLIARKGRLEGTVHVSCVISRNGEIMGTRVSGSSGHSVLDNAALRAVRSVGRFPPVPPELKGDSFSFMAPIAYRMNAD